MQVAFLKCFVRDWIQVKNAKLKRNAAWLIGFFLLLAYWCYLHPPTSPRLGYAEDLGGIELTRQIMADSLRRLGHPDFFSTRMVAPTGINATYCSWSLERDGIGALFWLWNPNFPFTWVYIGLSLLI